jgi:hypothetical protein
MQDESKDDWAKLITAASNQNLTAAKKELLVWHHRLSHASLAQIHTLCRQKRRLKVESTDDLVPICSQATASAVIITFPQ